MSFEVGQVLYELVDTTRSSGGFDVFGEWRPSRGDPSVIVEWVRWVVERVTPRGAWIAKSAHAFTGKRWVPVDTRRVSRTPGEAKAEAVRKRAYHAKMAEARARVARRRLQALERMELPGAPGASGPPAES